MSFLSKEVQHEHQNLRYEGSATRYVSTAWAMSVNSMVSALVVSAERIGTPPTPQGSHEVVRMPSPSRSGGPPDSCLFVVWREGRKKSPGLFPLRHQLSEELAVPGVAGAVDLALYGGAGVGGAECCRQVRGESFEVRVGLA